MSKPVWYAYFKFLIFIFLLNEKQKWQHHSGIYCSGAVLCSKANFRKIPKYSKSFFTSLSLVLKPESDGEHQTKRNSCFGIMNLTLLMYKNPPKLTAEAREQ